MNAKQLMERGTRRRIKAQAATGTNPRCDSCGSFLRKNDEGFVDNYEQHYCFGCKHLICDDCIYEDCPAGKHTLLDHKKAKRMNNIERAYRVQPYHRY